MAHAMSVKALPQERHLYARSYRTESGAKRTLYYVRFRDWKKVDRWFAAGDTLKDARELRDLLLGQNLRRHDFDAETIADPSFVTWADRWLALKAVKKSHDRYRLSVDALKAFFGVLRLSALTTSQVERYKIARLGSETRFHRPPTPATINRELMCLRAMLILAKRDRILERRPHIAMLEEHNLRERTAAPHEYRQLYEAIPAHMRPILILMKELGLRISEAVNLRSEHIDWRNRTLTLAAANTKTQRTRVLPLNDAVERALQSLPQGQATGRLFWHGNKPMTRHLFYDHFQRACQHLGIEGLWVHDIRGTFATEKLEAGHDRSLVKRLTGHTSDAAFERYVRPRLEHLRKIVE